MTTPMTVQIVQLSANWLRACTESSVPLYVDLLLTQHGGCSTYSAFTSHLVSLVDLLNGKVKNELILG